MKKSETGPSKQLLHALGSLTRWNIIATILAEGPMGVTELARYVRGNVSLVSKNVLILRKAGILYQGERPVVVPGGTSAPGSRGERDRFRARGAAVSGGEVVIAF
jgi:hypothetical protein